jgi:hypothetical protein
LAEFNCANVCTICTIDEIRKYLKKAAETPARIGHIRVPQTFAYGTMLSATEDNTEIAPVLGQGTVPASEVRDCRRSTVWVGALEPRG